MLVAWTGRNVAGLDPANGKPLWQYPFEPTRMVINVPTPVIEGDRLFVTAFYDGSLMLRLLQDRPAVEKIWRRLGPNEQNTDALHAMISTPYLEGDYVYGVDSYGQLRCLDAKTGDRVWEDRTAVPTARWATIHMVRNGKRMWMFNERGELLIGELSPEGFHEISRAKLLEPTKEQLPQRNGVCWSHPAYAGKHIYARNDRELVLRQSGGNRSRGLSQFSRRDDVALKKELHRRENGTVPFGRKGTGTFFGLDASTRRDNRAGRKMSQSPAACERLRLAVE